MPRKAVLDLHPGVEVLQLGNVGAHGRNAQSLVAEEPGKKHENARKAAASHLLAVLTTTQGQESMSIGIPATQCHVILFSPLYTHLHPSGPQRNTQQSPRTDQFQAGVNGLVGHVAPRLAIQAARQGRWHVRTMQVVFRSIVQEITLAEALKQLHRDVTRRVVLAAIHAGPNRQEQPCGANGELGRLALLLAVIPTNQG